MAGSTLVVIYKSHEICHTIIVTDISNVVDLLENNNEISSEIMKKNTLFKYSLTDVVDSDDEIIIPISKKVIHRDGPVESFPLLTKKLSEAGSSFEIPLTILDESADKTDCAFECEHILERESTSENALENTCENALDSNSDLQSIHSNGSSRTLCEDDSYASNETAHESDTDEKGENKEEIEEVQIVFESLDNNETYDIDSDSNSSNSSPLFPHKVGIRNHALNCYASALISCLYNIPMFQVSIFEDVKRNLSDPLMRKEVSPIAAIASIFYKMRFESTFIDLEKHFMPSVSRATSWEFGGLECVLEFWNKLSTVLSDESQNLFKIDLLESYYRKSDSLLIKSKPQRSNMILVAPSSQYSDIQQFLDNNFADEEAEDFIIDPGCQEEYSHLLNERIEEKLSIPSRTDLKILNCPDVLIFGVKRVRWNSLTNEPEFDSSGLGFSENLTINSEKYVIVGNVEFDLDRVHYIAQNHDLLDDQWYLHDDKRVEMIPDTKAAFDDLSFRFAHNSTMVFYVKCSLLDRFLDGNGTEIDFEVVNFIKRKSRRAPISVPLAELGLKDSSYAVQRLRNRTSKTQTDTVSGKTISDPNNVVKRPRGRPPKNKTNNMDNNVDVYFTDAMIDEIANDVVGAIAEDLSEDVVDELEIEINNIIKRPRGRPPKVKKTFFKKKVTVDSHENSSVSKDSSDDDFSSDLSDDESIKKVKRTKKRKRTNELDCTSEILQGSNSYFSFTFVNKYEIMETILFAYSCNPAAVRKLIQVASNLDSSDFVFKFTVIILKILSGKKEIDASALSQEIDEIHGIDLQNYGAVWLKVSELLPEDIAPIPDLKVIKYHLDEPLQIFKLPKWDHSHILPHRNVKCPTDLKFEGIAFDLKESDDGEYYRRNILKSDGIIFPLRSTRLLKSAEGEITYDSSPIQFSRGDFLVNGFIGVLENTFDLFAVFLDPQDPSHFLFFFKGTLSGILKSKQSALEVSKYLQCNSIIVLFTKNEHFGTEYPLMSEIPKVLLDEMNK